MTRPRPQVTVETVERGPEAASGRVRIAGLDEAAVVERIDGGSYRVSLAGRRFEVVVARERDVDWGWAAGRAFRWMRGVEAAGGESRAPGDEAIRAPMPAIVTAVAAVPGRTVAQGDTLAVIEAMKMELPVKAPRDGRVAAVRCAVGDRVDPDTPLIELDARDTAQD